MVWTVDEMAARAAADIPDGAYVNLGIGLPLHVANHLPADREIVFHSENGILGVGPAPDESDIDWDCIDAGKKPITVVPGGCFFDHATSFAMIRGSHIDIALMGAFQVSVTGDLANWDTGRDDGILPGVGGAMDLAAGAARVVILMKLRDKWGALRLVPRCSLPLTAMAVVSRVYTDYGVFEPTGTAFKIVELAPGVGIADIAHTEEERSLFA